LLESALNRKDGINQEIKNLANWCLGNNKHEVSLKLTQMANEVEKRQ